MRQKNQVALWWADLDKATTMGLEAKLKLVKLWRKQLLVRWVGFELQHCFQFLMFLFCPNSLHLTFGTYHIELPDGLNVQFAFVFWQL